MESEGHYHALFEVLPEVSYEGIVRWGVTIVGPDKEFSRAVGIRAARRGGNFPPFYHPSLPAGPHA
jgi:hypothetical protein